MVVMLLINFNPNKLQPRVTIFLYPMIISDNHHVRVSALHPSEVLPCLPALTQTSFTDLTGAPWQHSLTAIGHRTTTPHADSPEVDQPRKRPHPRCQMISTPRLLFYFQHLSVTQPHSLQSEVGVCLPPTHLQTMLVTCKEKECHNHKH